MEIHVYRGAENVGTYTLEETSGYTRAKPRRDILTKKLAPGQIAKTEALAKEMIEHKFKSDREATHYCL